METYQDLINYYRICKICKSNDCHITFLNNNFSEMANDIVDNKLRIFFSRKVILIDLITNKITCKGTNGIKSNNFFNNLKVQINSMCINCDTKFNSNSIHLTKKTESSLFKINRLYSEFIKNKYSYIIVYEFNNLIFSKRIKNKYDNIYEFSIPKFNIDDIDIHQFIKKYDSLQIFS